MKHSVLPVAALLVAGAFGAGQASAQTSASATANVSATVVGIAPLTATTVNDLDFGTVNAGSSGTVAPTDAARFLITGEPSFPVNVSFALPGNLAGPGGATIPITFGNADGLLWAPFPTTFTTFNPNGAFATNVDGFGNLEVGITGTVSPPGGTVSGVYTGTITVTVAY
jgi:spore coat protein U-like protein